MVTVCVSADEIYCQLAVAENTLTKIEGLLEETYEVSSERPNLLLQVF